MLLRKCFRLHEQLKKRLGEDLVFSLALSEGKCILTASVHKSSQWKFTHGKNFQQCVFTDHDLDRKVDKIVHILVEKFNEILVPRTPEDDPVDMLADELPFGGHAGDPPHISPGSDF